MNVQIFRLKKQAKC